MRFATLNTDFYYDRPEGYRVLLNSEGPWLRRWLIRRMWKWLHNAGALRQFEHRVETYEFGENEEREILSRVERQVIEILDSGSRIEDFALVVGAATWHELTGAIADRPMVFNLGGHHVYKAPDGYRMEFRGIPVHIAPRMNGCALVPKVTIERPARNTPPPSEHQER